MPAEATRLFDYAEPGTPLVRRLCSAGPRRRPRAPAGAALVLGKLARGSKSLSGLAAGGRKIPGLSEMARGMANTATLQQ